jgi:hypothetical protein
LALTGGEPFCYKCVSWEKKGIEVTLYASLVRGKRKTKIEHKYTMVSGSRSGLWTIEETRERPPKLKGTCNMNKYPTNVLHTSFASHGKSLHISLNSYKVHYLKSISKRKRKWVLRNIR